jgi:uncharacterized protein (TIGR01777 family)
VRNPDRARQILGDEIHLLPMPAEGNALREPLSVDAVINLAGEPVLGGRWTRERRRSILDSRVGTTQRCVTLFQAKGRRPTVFISTSAVGFYGDCGDRLLHESDAAGSGFLSEVCQAWEEAARAAESTGARVVRFRIGLVMGAGGGALGPMLPLFRVGLGGPIGHGRQYWPWIHLDDVLEAMVTALNDARYQGAFNLTAPTPVTCREFARTLGQVLGRPAFIPAPAFAVKLALGRASDAILQSQRAIPTALIQLGFQFAHPELRAALAHLL